MTAWVGRFQVDDKEFWGAAVTCLFFVFLSSSYRTQTRICGVLPCDLGYTFARRRVE
jgi:hypothetical protein